MQNIEISVSEEIFDLFPAYRRAVVVGRGVNNNALPDIALSSLLSAEQNRILKDIGIDDERLLAWREAFRMAGIKPSKFRPSIDALIRRILSGSTLRGILPLVDIGTILSLRHVVPCGAHSLDDVTNSLKLRLATGDEIFTPFGSEIVENIKKGEIIFADDSIVATAKWAWRQAEHTSVQSETKDFELNIDALGVISDFELEVIIEDARDLCQRFLGIDVTVHILSKNMPKLMI